MLKKLAKEEDLKEVIKNGMWLVDFSATWCGPCRMLEPVLESASETYNIVTIDVDIHEQLARTYGIMSVPSLFVFKDGELIKREVGYKNLEEIENLMNR